MQKIRLSPHWFRRIFHISLITFPILFYGLQYHYPPLPYTTILLCIVGSIFLFEIVRIWQGWLFWGQRAYEKKQLSAVAWGALGIGTVLLWAPHTGIGEAGYGLPIISSLAIVDPIVGELRRNQKKSL